MSVLTSAVSARASRAARPLILVMAVLTFVVGSFGATPPANAAPDTSPAAAGQSVVSVAMKYVGYRYRFGGSSPAGFDCTGFVYYVLNKSGVQMGRNMYSQFASGRRVSTKDLQPGDLVFFSNTYKRGLSHAGIYIGGGRFVNAANERVGVTVSNLWSSYWASHFTAAVRPY